MPSAPSTLAPRRYIDELRVQHFRSFGEECVLRFQPGLNVLVGANGSGKSNCIDALLFGLAQDASQLKARSWSDLAHRARRGPPCVRVHMAQQQRAGASGGDDALVLLSRVKQDGSRGLTLNGKAATLQHARESLLGFGLDADGSFCVRQGVAADTLSGAQVAHLLLQASGAARFNASASAAEAKLVRERADLERVRQTIAAIDAANARAREEHEARSQLRALKRRARDSKRSIRRLRGELGGAVAAERAERVAELRRELAAAEEGAEVARRALAEVEAGEAPERERLTAAKAEIQQARRALGAAADGAAAAEAAAVDAAVQQSVCAAERSEWGAARARTDARRHAAAVAVSRLVGQLAVLEQQAKERPSGAGAEDRLAACEASLARATEEAARMAEAVRVAEARARESAAEAAQAAALLSKAREARASSEAALARDAGDEASELARVVAQARAEVAAAASASRQASQRLRAHETSESPTLCSSLSLAVDDPRLDGCLTALHVIASSHLGVRLTPTARHAIPLLEAAAARGEAIRVWPLDRLRSRDASAEHAALKARFGTRMCVPAQLVRAPQELAVAVRAAFGSYLIVTDDATGAEVAACSTVPCVTLGGNLHERGRLAGGDRGDTSSFQWLRDRQVAEQARLSADSRAEAAAQALRAAEGAEAAAAEARDAEEEHTRRAARAAERAEAARLALSRARQAEAEAAAAEAACSARVMALRAAVQPRGAVGSLAGQDGSSQLADVTRRLAAAEQSLLEAELEAPLGGEAEEADLRSQLRELEGALARAVESIGASEAAAAEAGRRVAVLGAAAGERSEALQRLQQQRAQLEGEARAAEASGRKLAAELARAEARGGAEEVVGSDGSDGKESDSSEEGVDNAGEREGGEEMDGVACDGDGVGDDNGGGMSAKGSGMPPEGASSRTARLRHELNEAAASLHACKRRAEAVESRHGSRASLRARLHGSVAARLETMEQCKRKEAITRASIENLLGGIEQMRGRVAAANSAAFGAVRTQTRLLFSQLVPAMEVDLRCQDPTAPEQGVEVLLRSAAGDHAEKGGQAADDAEGGETRSASGGWRACLEELSGGQRTLLKLSLLLSVASYRPSMLLLLDEVDAALDEPNALRVAHMVRELSRSTQIIAVSHRSEFQRSAENIIRLFKNGAVTVAE
jgi:chromosome segregation protein